MTCTDPRFELNPRPGPAYGPCTRCGRLAWSHPQSDPAADIKNWMMWWAGSLDTYPYPVMRPVEDPDAPPAPAPPPPPVPG